ncbi:MAG: Maf family nucleotide pyrophosphatase [Proteobacteria bacterium]|nr:Maf family nucleotide pyrophosphatase [Pseudomonadota bacterium]
MRERYPQLVLASASPRRAALLTQLGLVFTVNFLDIDESRRADETAIAMVQRLALTKARVVAHGEILPVLGADTVVVVDDVPLGKPIDRDDGVSMLTQLSGRGHDVLTAVALVQNSKSEVRLSRSRVFFREISQSEAQAYWLNGEPRDKAGGYGIQGIGGIFAQRIEGSYSGIVGLPLAETEALLQAFGVDTWRYRGV